MIPPFLNPRTQDMRIAAGQTIELVVSFEDKGSPVDRDGEPFGWRVRKANGEAWDAERWSVKAKAVGNRVRMRLPGTSTIEWANESGLVYEVFALNRDGMDYILRGRFTAEYSGALVIADLLEGGGAEQVEVTSDPAVRYVVPDFRGPGVSDAVLDGLVSIEQYEANGEIVDQRFTTVNGRVDTVNTNLAALSASTGTRLNALEAAGSGGGGLTTLGHGAYQGEAGPFITTVGSELDLIQLPIPAGVMGAGGMLEVYAVLIHPPSAATKTMAVRFSGSTNPSAGPIHAQEIVTDATKQTTILRATIFNTAANAQISVPAVVGGSASSTALPSPGGANTNNATYLHITGMLGAAGRIGVAAWYVRLVA